MTNITVTCVDLAVRYHVQPRYGAMLAKMDYKAKLEEEEGRLSFRVPARYECTMLVVGRLCDRLPSSTIGAYSAREGAASSTPRSWTSR